MADESKYDGAKNTFNVPQESIGENAKSLNMTEKQYLQHLDKFVRSYSSNPLFAYQHTDLSDVPITFEDTGGEGVYNTKTGAVRITPKASLEEMTRTLIHELNHAATSRNPDWGKMKNYKRADLRAGSDDQAKALYAALTKAGFNYDETELPAFIAEGRHPALKNRPIEGAMSARLSKVLAEHIPAADKYYGKVAQPNRPEAVHYKAEPEWSTTERLLNMVLGVRPFASK